MKCIDCKYCAFINNSDEEIITKSNGIEIKWYALKGAFCMKVSCNMGDIEECSSYEKSKHKKIKTLK